MNRSLVPIIVKYQYAWKQGLNLSNSLGLEVREDKLNLTSNILKVENKYDRDHDTVI